MDLLAVLQQVLLQTGLGTSQSNAWLIFLSNIIWIAMIFLFFFQDYVMIWRYAYTVGSFLTNLNRLITNNVNLVINHVDQLLRSNGSPKNVNKDAIEKTIKDLMDFVPTLSPNGLVPPL